MSAEYLRYLARPPKKIVITLTRPHGYPALIIGRLYVGYVGIIWVNRLFEFDLWILKPQKGAQK